MWLIYIEKKLVIDLDFFDNLKEEFYTKTGFTISIGIGKSILEALFNLRVAKLSGKNKIITEFN